MAWFDTLKTNFENKIKNDTDGDITRFVKSAPTQTERDARAALVKNVLRPRLEEMVDDEADKVISRADAYVSAGQTATERAQRAQAVMPKAAAALDNYAEKIISLVRQNIEEKRRETVVSKDVSHTSDRYDDYVSRAVDFLMENGIDLLELEDMDTVIDLTSHVEAFLKAEGMDSSRAISMASGIVTAASDRYKEELLASREPAAVAAVSAQVTPPPRPMVAAPAVAKPAQSKPAPVTAKSAEATIAALLATDFSAVEESPTQVSADRQLMNVIIQKGIKSKEGTAAFNEIYKKYQPYVTNFVRGYGNKFFGTYPELRTQVDDIVQTTFLKMIKGVDSFSDKASLKTWLAEIAKNNLIDTVRKYTTTKSVFEPIEDLEEKEGESEKKPKMKRKVVYGQRQASIEAAEEDETSAFASRFSLATPEDIALRNALTDKISGTLERLKAKSEVWYNIYRMYHLPDESDKTYDYKDIAKILEIPIGTVMSGINRSRAFVEREVLNDPSIKDLYIELQTRGREQNNSKPIDIEDDPRFFDDYILPVMLEVMRRDDEEYDRSPQSAALRRRILSDLDINTQNEELVSSIMKEKYNEENYEYGRSSSRVSLHSRIMGQVEKYDLQKRVLDAIRPKYRMPLEMGYATGYAKHLIFGTPEPKTTSLPKDRAAQVKSYVRLKFNEISE